MVKFSYEEEFNTGSCFDVIFVDFALSLIFSTEEQGRAIEKARNGCIFVTKKEKGVLKKEFKKKDIKSFV